MGFKFKVKNPVTSIASGFSNIAKNPLNPKSYIDSGLRMSTGGQLDTESGKSLVGMKTDVEKAQEAEKKNAGQFNSSILQGRQAGLDLAKTGYGQGLEETGQDVQRIRQLQKDRTDQSGADPVSAAIMAQKAGAVASANRSMAAQGVKGGVAAGAAEQISRQRDSDIAASLYGQQRQSISDEKSLAGNTLAGTTGLMFGSSGEAAAGAMPRAPQTGGMMDSVICTELYFQGKMPFETYLKDSDYGSLLMRTHPHIVMGYHFWAKPVVKLMKKSKVFSKLISYPALKWARHIAGEEYSFIGAICVKVGQPLCGFIGKLKLIGDKYAIRSY